MPARSPTLDRPPRRWLVALLLLTPWLTGAAPPDLPRARPLATVFVEDRSNEHNAALSSDGRLLAVAYLLSKDRIEVDVWDWAAKKRLARLRTAGDYVVGLAFSPDGKTLGCSARALSLWDTATWRLAREVKLPGRSSGDFVLHRGLVAFPADNVVEVWDVAIWKRKARLRGHKLTVTALAFSPDGRRLVTVASDMHSGMIRGLQPEVSVWDVLAGEEIEILRPPKGFTRQVAISPDGKWAACGSRDGTVALWSVRGDRHWGLRKPVGDQVKAVGFTAEGRGVVACLYSGRVECWDTRTGKLAWAFALPPQARVVVLSAETGLLAAHLGPFGMQVWRLPGVAPTR